jgi:hypothetical protein
MWPSRWGQARTCSGQSQSSQAERVVPAGLLRAVLVSDGGTAATLLEDEMALWLP